MTEKNLKTLLCNSEYKSLADTLTPVKQGNQILNHLYKIGTEDSDFYIIKIRPVDHRYVADSIHNLNTMVDKSNLFSRYKNVLRNDKFFILITEFSDGSLFHPHYRDQLPRLFSKLAKFNLNNKVSGPFTSMYCDGNYFNTIEQMIDWELDYHLSYWTKGNLKTEVIRLIQPLKSGLPCLMNEDLNLGNMHIYPDNQFRFIDTEWLQQGLNLYQFEHVDYFGFNGDNTGTAAWYSIHKEAKECYTAYFSQLPVSKKQANDQIKAFETLGVLRQNTYWRFSRMEEHYGKEINRLNRILKTPEFF